MVFDEHQKKVIGIKDGHWLVLAPPGCGKTELLTHRILKAASEGIPYEDMLCLTFTNRAARGMRERISAAVKGPCEGLFVGNIHKFCARYLFDNHLVSVSTGIIDELDQRDILDEFGFTKYNDNCENRNEQFLISDVTRLAAIRSQLERRHPNDILLDEPAFRSGRARIVAEEMANRYYEYKNENSLIDFDDILILAYSELRKDTGKTNLYSEYHWIQVDEVQDLNALQLAVIDCITAKENYTVLYLGDEQQAIYSFMGARLGSLTQLAKKSGENHVLRLYTNYRSPKYLVDMLNTYADKNLHLDVSLLPKALGDEVAEKGTMSVFEYRDDDSQLSGIGEIVAKVTKNYPQERVGILVRTNRQADDISKMLNEKGIRHFRLSGQDVFRGDDYKTLLSHFTVLQNDTSYFDWARLLYRTGATFSFKDARDLCARMRRAGLVPSDFLRYPEGTGYLKSFLEMYESREFVIFDTETTGLDIMNDDIIQIAAVKVRGGAIVRGSEFNVIIKTEKEIPPMLGREQNPMLEVYRVSIADGTAKSAEEAFGMFLDYVGKDEVLGHNVRFDYRILRQNLLRRMGGTKIANYIRFAWDSLKIIRILEPRLRVYKLRSLLETFGLEGENSHRADDDILATKSLVDLCAEKAKAKMNIQDELWRDVNVVNARNKFLANYGPFWRKDAAKVGSDSLLYDTATFVKEMKQTYKEFVGRAILEEIPGAEFVFDFLSKTGDGNDANPPRPLIEIISDCVKDFRTYNQSDLCDSGIIPDRVFVMTVHKAKGLEFEHVLLPGAVHDSYPFFASKSEDEKLEDARLFYVGLSRAKKRISVLYYASYKGFSKKLTPFLDCVFNDFVLYQR